MAFGGTVKLTGESEYKKALADITGNLKVLNSEMKVVTSQYDRNDKSTENLTQQNDVLNKKIAEQKEKVDILSKALADAEQETGKNSSTSQKWQTELNNAQAELNKLVKNVNDNEKAMEQSADATKENAESVDKFGEEAEDSGKQALKLGDIIKANLISDAIKSGLTALANGVKAVGSAMSESLSAGAEYADNILTLSTQTGVSTENLQKYNAVAELVDVSTETMTKSMAKNIKSMTSAQEGSGAMAEAYAKLGVSVTNADGTLRDGETVYWETIDALKNVTDETERDSLAMELLGKSAQELNPLIAQGSEGIKAMGDEAVRMGAVLSEDALNGLGALDDEMQRFSSISSATSNLLASAFAPAISTLMGGVNDLGSSFNYLISSIISGDEGGIAEATTMISEGVTAMVENISTNAPKLIETVGSLLTTIVGVIAENLPKLTTSILSLIPTLISLITSQLPVILDVVLSLIPQLVQLLADAIPILLDAVLNIATQVINSLAEILPQVLTTIVGLIPDLITTILDALPLLIDAVLSLVLAIVEALPTIIQNLIQALPTIIQSIVSALLSAIPLLLSTAIELLMCLVEAIPTIIKALIKALPEIINTIITQLLDALPLVLDGAIELLMAVITAIPTIIEALIVEVPNIVITIINTLLSQLPNLILGAVKLLMGIVQAIPQIVVELAKQVPKIITQIVTSLSNGISSVFTVGKNLVSGIWEGISNSLGWIKDKISGWVGNVTSFIKRLFGINSPSRLFRDEIGTNLALGLGEGFGDTMHDVSQDMADAIPTEFDANIHTNVGAGYSSTSNYDVMLMAFKQALAEVKVVMNNREMGAFVTDTMGKVVYS